MFKRFIFLLCISIFMLIGCANETEESSDKKPKDYLTIDAVILEMNDRGGFLVETSEVINGKIVKGECKFGLDDKLYKKGEFKVGDEITIKYHGISESYPSILEKVTGIELKE